MSDTKASHDVRVRMTARNARILGFMERQGIKTVAELCRRADIPGEQSAVGRIINMRRSP
jgi:hypothetical protein